MKKRKIKAITPFKVIQGHRGRYQSKARMRLLIRSPYFAFSPNSIALLANYVTAVNIMSVNIVSQFQSSTFGHN